MKTTEKRMLSFAFLVTGAQAGIWEAAMSLLNSGNGLILPHIRYQWIVSVQSLSAEIKLEPLKATIDMPSGSKLHFEQNNSTKSLDCGSSFDFLDMKFSSIELADPSEYFFVSDNTEYVVTKLENSWLLHNVIDDDLLMFGLSGKWLIHGLWNLPAFEP